MSAPASALVLFGISGDLAHKLVLPALYRLEARGELDQPIVGVARSEWDTPELRHQAEGAVREALGELDEDVLGRFLGRLEYVAGEYDDSATFDRLKELLGERAERAVYYLAVPPSLFATVAAALAREGLNGASRLVIEKPFGTDLASARALDADLRASFPEERLLRVDHFLGKEAVEDLLVFRFANRLFEPVWNRDHVRSVQLSLAETLDVADRGSFYDAVGAIRDVVENHLFQVLAYLAMDPPAGADSDAEQRERTRLLRSVRTLRREDVVRGQYRGYREVEGVHSGSVTETYIAARLWIDNWRWHGVPFLVRAGKCLPVGALEAVVELREPPPLHQIERGPARAANLVRLRLQPDAGITTEILAKQPGPGYATRTVPLRVDFEPALGPSQLAYERVLADALAGPGVHFTSMEAVEQAWRIVDPVLDLDEPPLVYEPGSWGPVAADTLPGPSGWHRLSVAEP